MYQFMAPASEKTCENTNSPPTPLERQGREVDPNSERTRATRHPRWTRQETLVLIEAKKVVENGRTGMYRYTSTPGSVSSEPKWDMVSSFCKKQGVNREAVQCRKRWSNLLSDFKKIKKWESNMKEENTSFWMMRKEERKENKLPGFFDGELYNVLDGEVCSSAAVPLATSTDMRSRAENAEEDEEEEEEAEADDDSEKMGWSTEDEIMEENMPRMKVPAPLNESAAKGKIKKGTFKEMPNHPLPSSGSGCRRERRSQGAFKRMRLSPDNCEDTAHVNNQLVKVLKRNSNMVKAHLGAQNINYQLAREQQKEQTDSLVAALGKLTDALTKIADKL